jgi:hypothetical protein
MISLFEGNANYMDANILVTGFVYFRVMVVAAATGRPPKKNFVDR